MIRWNNDEKVFVRLGPEVGSLVLRWNRSSRNSTQIELIDKTGSLYYVKKENVKIIVPETIDKSNMKNLLIIDPEDLYAEPPKKEKPKRIKYRAKKYKTQRKREAAFKRK